MKKILLFASALAGLFLAGSCQRENLEPVAGGNTVTYTVQLPDAIGTKAPGESVSNVTELVYAVYLTGATDKDDHSKTETKLFQKIAEIEDGIANIEFELINNQNFRVLFWAQVPGTGVYDTANLKNVTMKQSLTANVDDYTAFAGADFIKYGDGLAGRKQTLTRPLGQLNIGTTQSSLDIEGQTTVIIETTAVTVNGLSTSYNVAEAKAGEISTVNYVYSASDPAVLGNLEVNGTTYAYVAMNYVGFAEQTGSNVKVGYTINTKNVGVITNDVENVPVKANYRTNIIGNLITATSDYKITLDSDWADEPDEPYVVEVVSVSTAADLQEAINNISDGAEGNIKLEGDINLNDLVGLLSTKAAPAYGLLIPETKTVVLDLGGYTLTGNAIVDGSKVHVIVNNGTLTIMNGTLTANGTNGGSAISNNGTLTITDATVNGASSDTATGTASYAVNSQGTESKLVVNNSTINGRGVIGATKGTKVEINGGTYHTPAVAWGHAIYAVNTGTEVVINGGTFSEGYEASDTNWGMYQIYSGDKANVIVNSGDFSQPWDCANGYDLCTATEGTIEIYGGSFAEDPSSQNGINYVADGYGVVANENGTFTVEKLPTAAKIGDTEYLKLAEAVNNVKEGETITILEGTIEEGTIKLPAALKNVRFLGEEGAILKDMTIMAHDGNSISYEGLTFEGLTFENSRISISGWRTNGAVVKNFTVTNCIFRNLDDNTNSAPVHINMAATEPVNGFIFTNNVIDGATGGSKSGIYAQVTGEVLVSGNIINNVAFRPYVIQVTTDDNIADNFVVTNNTFSGSAAGRAQGLGNNAEGTDAVNIVVNENIFKGITDAQQICYWNFNDATTEFDLSGNYYDIDILANPSRIYYNGAASGLADLIAKNIFPIYTELNADGTINKDSAYSPVLVAKVGDQEYGSLRAAVDAVEDGGTITLIENVTFTERERECSGGTWYEGLYYLGDKSFTIDLNRNTISQNGAVNDYMFLFKNEGAKDNVITFKNGTIDAGTAAYCALCTSTTSTKKITLNVENLNITGNNSNGAVCKIRGGAEFNVKAGTVITGQDSYVGIESYGATTNIYEGAKIYQNGTTSYVGSLVGVSSNGTVNVYGGEGTSKQGGFIAMTSGGTINIEGGEWIANADGTYANGNNSVLISQSASGAKSIVNVTGGTFKGGYNCYGDAAGDAQINIKGGNFNANPENYVVAGYEVTENAGTYTVEFLPAAAVGATNYNTLQEALNAGGEITLLRDVKLTDMAVLEAGKTATLDLNGCNITVPDATKHIYAINNKGNLTLKDSKGTGSVKARGIYNGYNGSNSDETVEGATMTVESGNFYTLDSDGGAAIFNCAKAIINGGVFDGQVAAFNGRKYAETTINGGVFRSVKNYAIQQNNGGELTINDAKVNRGFGAVGCFGAKVTIADGEFLPTGTAGTTCHVVYVAAGADVTINGGTYKMNYPENAVPDSGSAVASYYNGTLAINGGTFTAHFDNVSPVELSSGSTIKGGTYYNHAGVASQHSYITNFVAEGYELNANGEVVKK